MGLREQKKARVRQRILTVCGRLFRTRGFDETTIEHIVDAAEISRPTFFNYFAGKEAVLTELGLAWLAEQAAAPRAGLGRGEPGAILGAVRSAIVGQLRAVQADRAFMRLVFTRSGVLFPQGFDRGPDGAAPPRMQGDHARAVITAIAAILGEAQVAREIRSDVNVRHLAEMYSAVMLMTIRLWLMDFWHDGADLESWAMHALDVLEHGCRAEPS